MVYVPDYQRIVNDIRAEIDSGALLMVTGCPRSGSCAAGMACLSSL